MDLNTLIKESLIPAVPICLKMLNLICSAEVVKGWQRFPCACIKAKDKTIVNNPNTTDKSSSWEIVECLFGSPS